jgi:hypothetical protein
MQNELTVIIEQSGLEKSQTELLLSKFTTFFNDARQTVKFARDIVVTDETQVEAMESARKTRLELKSIRVMAENTRKELKEQSLREGKAIDGIANVIKALIVPVEDYLEKQEKFAEIKMLERMEKKNAERIEKLSHYVEDVSVYGSLIEMSDAAFDKLLETSKFAYEARQEAEKLADAERLAKEESDRVEQQRIREENIRLHKEAHEREAQMIKEQAEQTRLAAIEKKKQDDALAVERKAREEAEAKLRAEQHAVEEKQRAESEAKFQAEQAEKEARRQALLAPDKEKILQLASKLSFIGYPAVESREAKEIIDYVEKIIDGAIDQLNEGAKKL